MIKFFRKIRQRLLTEGKTGSYLKYAFGEIILVVIGILIALQINLWNEDRKLKIQETKTLQNFVLSLSQDSAYHAQSTVNYEKAINSINYLIDYMEKDLPYKDTLKFHFSNMTSDWGLRYDFSTYESLMSNDINLISNESLRSDIISYYNYAGGLAASLSQRYTEVIEDASKAILSKHFDQMWNGRPDVVGEMVPIDYEELKKDHQFKYFLKTLKNQNFWLIQRPLKISKESYQQLARDIELEIKKLSKD
ncbi:DUF6090 family protein [Fulvivirga sedimenti]|uniref:Uncharacterized protein n=1 Tax=Fulvivirga sedimenti TaxID=2879465 RepID=A0A9X1HVQ5_9BACT|nr:DUF6090 family protein [Fulvivirga sedimenti]MCA6075034.1 hypothetical protein [Fulvivirga sedimenti]MCA6076211.1 hypothetical protein [Fulvivirga sedimenti]MCA6077339.1 hypothetical protein [Fulvivirga sedimenti]